MRQMTYTEKLRDEIRTLELKEAHLEVEIKRLKSENTDLKEQAISVLIKLAAQMVRNEGMPSYFLEDWELPKTTPVRAMRKIQDKSTKACETATCWGRQLRKVIDFLRAEGREC